MSANVQALRRGGLRGAQRESGNVIGAGILLFAASFISPLFGALFALVLFATNRTRGMAAAASIGIAFAAAFAAHGIEYKHATDMTRWMIECGYYAGEPLSSIFTSLNGDHQNLWIWNLACWVCGNIGDLHLLQSMAAFIGYGLMSWLMFSNAAEEKTSLWALIPALLFLFLAVPTQPIVGNVRSTVGCIMCAVAFCGRKGYSFKESLPGFVLIVVACLIHDSMVIALAIYLVQPLIARAPVKFSIILALCILVLVGGSSLLYASGIFNGIPFMQTILQKASFYTTGTEWDQEQATDALSNVRHILCLVLLALLFVRVLVTGQRGGRTAVVLAVTLCVFAMEATLVNVGNRLQYIPILIGATLLLNNQGREIAAGERWPLFIDAVMLVVAFAICMISMSSFIPSFNYGEVMKAMVFFPGSVL
jgi:hypothetical protein